MRSSFVFLLSVLLVSTCGLSYELIASASASQLTGDSILHFSTVIGIYLFAMGIGSYLSGFLARDLVATFVRTQIAAGFIGGVAAALLFGFGTYVASFQVFLYVLVALEGLLIGVGIPILMRVLKANFDTSELVSRVFALDYLGALFASVLFPLFFLRRFGLIRSGALFGTVNVACALMCLFFFRDELRKHVRKLMAAGSTAVIVLAVLFVQSDRIMSFSESVMITDKVVFATTTPYQRIVLTRGDFQTRLYLNGYIQFSTLDEYRYHESLIHVGLQTVPEPKNALILGGGDGLAAREILKYPSIQSVTLVDIDPDMTYLFSTRPELVELNAASLVSPKTKVVNEDAFVWAKRAVASGARYDFIAVDFPDPSNFSIGKLYSTAFYSLLFRLLNDKGVIAIQSTSPITTPRAYWSVNRTLESVGFKITPYHVHIPSFIDQGYVIATKGEFRPAASYLPGLKFVDPETVRDMLHFSKDLQPVPAEINRLNNQILVRYYMRETQGFRR